MSEGDTWTNGAGQTVQINQAKPKNTQAIQKNLWEGPEIKSFRESFRRKFGFDFADRKAFPVGDSGFSWKKVANKLGHGSIESCLREADSATSFNQVLRAGVQTLVNAAYETVPVTYDSWTSTVNSTRDTELHAPLHGISFMREVGKQELFSESYAAGLDIKLTNRKYGQIYAVERELLEDKAG